MDKLNFKKHVLEEARKRQQELIDDFRVRINELKNSEMDIIDLSHHAPLFLVMKDKKAGETFSYNGREYKILELY